MTYITKEEFDEFKKTLFKYLKDNFEMKPKLETIPKPLEEKLKQWTKPSVQSVIDELPL